MGDPLELRFLSKGVLSDAVSGGLLACNPAIDLAATVSNGSVLNIWRHHGEQVSKYTERNRKVEALRWRQDGQFLAVGWSNGAVKLMALENTKAVHHIVVPQAKISCIAWSRNRVGRRPSDGAPSSGSGSWDRLLSGQITLGHKQGLSDLPHELTFLEVDTALPKISPLPVSGGSGDDMFVFSTRTSLDFVFRPFQADDTDTVDVMLVGTEDGSIRLIVYDSFVIGDFCPALSDDSGVPGVLRLCCHASHPDLSAHSLLLRPQGDDRRAVYLVPMDLTFAYSWPVNLSLLASKATALQNLLRYIKQAQVHMVSEWKTTRELPSRFLLGVQEDLDKMPNGPVSIVQALYHTVVTGHVLPAVREWLVDSLAERGHRRWEKAVVSGLESLRSLVHENMIPALERAAIILSRLLGIARFHTVKDKIGFSAAHITRLLDIVSCLMLASHRILLQVMEELDLFAAFSSWMRSEIDKLASSSVSDEMSEKEATMDYAKILAYIRRFLKASPLALYLGDVDKDVYQTSWKHAQDAPSLLEVLDEQVKRQESGQPVLGATAQLGFLVSFLAHEAESLLSCVAVTQKQSVRLGRETRLEIGNDISKYDMRMCVQRGQDRLDSVTFAAIASEKAQNEVHVFRTCFETIDGTSSAVSTGVASLSVEGGAVIDFKFLNDTSLLLLWSPHEPNAAPILLNIPFQSLSYAAYENKGVPQPRVKIQRNDNGASHGFSSAAVRGPDGASSNFVPVQMQVMQSSSSRGELPARVCLLGRDNITYKTLALPDEWEPKTQLAA